MLGFDVIQIPPDVYQRLKAAVDAGLEQWDSLRYDSVMTSSYYSHNSTGYREERQIDAVYTPLPSKFIDLFGLDSKVRFSLRKKRIQSLCILII
jgi:hypothetical protein